MNEQSFTKKEKRASQRIVKKFTKAIKRKKSPDIEDYVKKCSSEKIEEEVRRLCSAQVIVGGSNIDPFGDLGCH